MSCAVYCLVPDPKQLDPLVGRLQEAGVHARDIMVVRRRGAEAPDRGARNDYFAPALWSLPLGAAAWWWPLAIPASTAMDPEPASTAGVARAAEHEVISLASYRARRASGAL